MKLQELHEEMTYNVKSVMGRQPRVFTGADFYCDDKKLTSLEGCPEVIIGYFYANNNKLTSLIGGPKEVNGYYRVDKNKLQSLEGIATDISGDLNCADNKLKSLKGIHKLVKRAGRHADFTGNPIVSHVLGLLKIEGLEEVRLDNATVANIMNRHLKGDRDIFACQEELVDVGFEEYAKL